MATTGQQQRTGEAPGVVLSVFRYWRLTVLIVAGFAAVAFGASLLLPERYVAYTEIGLTDPGGGGLLLQTGRNYQPEDLERYTARQAQLVESATTFDRVREITGRDLSDDELYDAITTDYEIATVIGVSVGDDDPATAKTLADAVVSGFAQATEERTQDEVDDALGSIDPAREQVLDDIEAAEEERADNPGDTLLDRQLTAALTSLDALNARANDIQVFAANFNDGIDYVEAAREPSSPAEPQPLRNALVAGLVGLVLAGVLAWIRADRHQAADEASDAEGVLGAPMLGTIPDVDDEQDLAALREPASVPAEAFRSVAASLQYLFRAGVLLVTSPGRRDGKTVCAASTAAAAAREGVRVVLVDADARSHGLTTRLLGTSGEVAPGLVDLASDGARPEQVVRYLALEPGVTLPFVPAGGEGAALTSLLRSEGMATALADLRSAYDLVVLDCPALLGVADVPTLAAHADGIVVVVSRGTPLRSLDAVAQRLELVAAPLVGYVFTRDDSARPTSAYGSSFQMPWHLVRTSRRSAARRAETGQNGDGRRSRRRARSVAVDDSTPTAGSSH